MYNYKSLDLGTLELLGKHSTLEPPISPSTDKTHLSSGHRSHFQMGLRLGAV